MGFQDRKMDFEEADRQYVELARKRDSGSISKEEFDAERQRLMVLDKQGRWWAKSAATGEWNYHDGNAWVRGVPPGYEPPGGEASAEDAPEPRSQTGKSAPPPSESQAREVVDGGETRPSRVPLRRPILLVVFMLLVVLGWGAYALTRGTSRISEDVAVPDLAGASSVEEAQRIAGKGFEVVKGDSVESREPIGAVVSQDPAAEEMVEPSSAISVNLSKGVNLPDVEGKARDEAVRILKGKGFRVKEETEESSAENEGDVTEQHPQGGEGESAEAGTTVGITVGAGPPDTETESDAQYPTDSDESSSGPVQILVPNVVGTTVQEAEQTIQSAGFTYTVETVQSDQIAGTVVSTDPAPGTLLDPASRVVIIRQSSGPPVVEEPTPEPSPYPEDGSHPEPLPPPVDEGGSTGVESS